MCGCAGINVDDLLLKKVAFLLAESYGYGLKTRLRQKNKQLFFLHKVNIYTCSATYAECLGVYPASLWGAQTSATQLTPEGLSVCLCGAPGDAPGLKYPMYHILSTTLTTTHQFVICLAGLPYAQQWFVMISWEAMLATLAEIILVRLRKEALCSAILLAERLF